MGEGGRGEGPRTKQKKSENGKTMSTFLINKLLDFSEIIPFTKEILLLTFLRKENILKTT